MTVTVNGAPLKEYLGREKAAEAAQIRAQEIKQKKWKRPSITSGQSRSGRDGRPRMIYTAAQMEQHVIIAGTVFPWSQKAPYVASGASILGGIEATQDLSAVKCHECGGWYSELSFHIKAHGVTGRQYKLSHGLRHNTPLRSPNAKRTPRCRLSQEQSRLARKKAQLARATRNWKSSGYSPELANLYSLCKAQLTEKVLALCNGLGRTPTAEEMKSAGLSRKTLEKRFNLKMADIFQSLGMRPNSSSRLVREHYTARRRATTI